MSYRFTFVVDFETPTPTLDAIVKFAADAILGGQVTVTNNRSAEELKVQFGHGVSQGDPRQTNVIIKPLEQKTGDIWALEPAGPGREMVQVCSNCGYRLR